MTTSRRWPTRYLTSAGVGVVAGVVYALLHVTTPAPPPLGLLGLAGILLGEAIVSTVLRRRRHPNGDPAVDPDLTNRPVRTDDDLHDNPPQEGTA